MSTDVPVSIDLSRHYAYPRENVRIVDGEGVYARDADGKTYIDCASGTFNLSLGYRHSAIAKAIQESSDLMVHVPSWFQVDVADRLVQKLVDVSPPNMNRVHLKVTGGSTANEGAIKLALRHSGGRDVISMFRAHHGQTFAMTAISGNAFRREPYPDFPISSVKVPEPYCHRCFYGQKRETCGLMCVDRIDDFLEFASSGHVGALIIEPILGSGGNIVPPDGYLQKLQAFCRERGIPLIFDEVQTGIGRTGSMFAAQHFGVEPDIITSAKGLGGGSASAAILTTDEIACPEAVDLAFTFGANLLNAAIAYATLNVIDDEDFLANVRATGARIRERLESAKVRFQCVDDVRGVGLMNGFEIVDADNRPSADLANHIANAGREHGLMLRTSRFGRGNLIKVRPPLILTMDEADLICDRIEETLKAAVK